MGYRDDFYVVGNIIGYTGTVQSNATVYFRQGTEFGHITQSHDVKVNVGREAVHSHANYQIGNEMVGGGPRLVERIGPGNGNVLHTSRSQFVAAGTMSRLHVNLVSQSIINFTEKKKFCDMTRVQQEEAIYGEEIQGLDVRTLLDQYERLSAL